MATRFADVAANIVLPTLYVRGAMSELVSPDDAADFVERLPDGEFAEVEDMALVVTDDRNDALGAYLIDFLRSEEQTSELQSLLRSSYAASCLQKTNTTICGRH